MATYLFPHFQGIYNLVFDLGTETWSTLERYMKFARQLETLERRPINLTVGLAFGAWVPNKLLPVQVPKLFDRHDQLPIIEWQPPTDPEAEELQYGVIMANVSCQGVYFRSEFPREHFVETWETRDIPAPMVVLLSSGKAPNCLRLDWLMEYDEPRLPFPEPEIHESVCELLEPTALAKALAQFQD